MCTGGGSSYDPPEPTPPPDPTPTQVQAADVDAGGKSSSERARKRAAGRRAVNLATDRGTILGGSTGAFTRSTLG